jgi:hypothetical protein
MDDPPSYTDKVRQLVPLTPAGLSAYGRAGWRVILAELLAAIKALPAADLARLAALAVFMSEEQRKQKGR